MSAPTEFDPDLAAACVRFACAMHLTAEACAHVGHAAFGAGAAMGHFGGALHRLKMEQRLAEIERDLRGECGEK